MDIGIICQKAGVSPWIILGLINNNSRSYRVLDGGTPESLLQTPTGSRQRSMITPDKSLLAIHAGDYKEKRSVAMDILINTLAQEGKGQLVTQSSALSTGRGKSTGRVSFNPQISPPRRANMYAACSDDSFSVTSSLLVPNVPINQEHRTLLGEDQLNS